MSVGLEKTKKQRHSHEFRKATRVAGTLPSPRLCFAASVEKHDAEYDRKREKPPATIRCRWGERKRAETWVPGWTKKLIAHDVVAAVHVEDFAGNGAR
jgi:hypothetical protein